MSYSKYFSLAVPSRENVAIKGAPPLSWEDVKLFVECRLINKGLLEAYNAGYPLVEPRELIPAFDSPLIEYSHLPAFSLLMLNRRLSYMDEIFQFDMLYPEGQPLDHSYRKHNLELLKSRLPRNLKPGKILGSRSITSLKTYPLLLPFLLGMDRAQVIARDKKDQFYLAGIFASFPSDLDRQIKRLGYLLGKFKKKDNRSYACNRQFVYRFLMESLGFSIVGERHTSAALFALRLLRQDEQFSIMVLGHSDRAITILEDAPASTSHNLPAVSKIALMAAPGLHSGLQENGFYVDPARKVVLIKVSYQHHPFHHNITQAGRALSVLSQEVIHPQTGQTMEFDILGLSQDKLLMLNSIVKGEYGGSIVYEGKETIHSTRGVANKLKFLSAWLQKHRFIFAEYSQENFEKLNKLLSSYLYDPEKQSQFSRYSALYMKAHEAWQGLLLAHRLHSLEKLVDRHHEKKSGNNLSQAQIFTVLSQVLALEGEDLLHRSPENFNHLLSLCNKEINVFCKLPGAAAEDDQTRMEMKHLRNLVNRHRRRLNKAAQLAENKQ